MKAEHKSVSSFSSASCFSAPGNKLLVVVNLDGLFQLLQVGNYQLLKLKLSKW